MTARNATATRVTVATLSNATLSSDEAGLLLPLAAAAAIKGKAEIDAGKAKGASALAVMVAGFACDSAALRQWSFDITAADGSVHHHVDCVGAEQYGDTSAEWVRNGQGAISKAAQSAFNAGFVAEFFNLKECTPAIRTMFGKAVPMARAIRNQGMIATIDGGKLVLSGGHGEKADAMRAAKSLSALAKVANDEAGSNRAAPQNEAGKGEADGRPATPEEITRAAVAIAKEIAAGKADACNATLSNLRALAKLIAANPDAFADD